MGVTHSMEDGQVKRISKALSGSANAIQGINTKFDVIDEHVQKLMEFNRATNSKVNKVLSSFERLDDTFNDRAEMLLESLVGATNTLTEVLETAAVSLDKVNIRQELDNIPKAMITLAIPFVILVIELAVSNAYLGILLASLPSIPLRYSNYLIAYASVTLMGLFLSLMWLVCYRLWLSTSCQKRRMRLKEEETLRRLSRLRTRSSQFSEDQSAVSDSSHDRDQKTEASELDLSGSDTFLRKQSPRSPGEAVKGNLSLAKARRMERKRARETAQNDDAFSWSGSEKPYPSPLTSPVHAPAAPLNLPALPEVFQFVQDERDNYVGRFSDLSGAEEALQHAKELAAQAEQTQLPDPGDGTGPAAAVPDESRGYMSGGEAPSPEKPSSDKGKRSMMQMRWNTFENPFGMNVTWSPKGKDVKDVKDGEVSQGIQGQTAQGSGEQKATHDSN